MALFRRKQLVSPAVAVTTKSARADTQRVRMKIATTALEMGMRVIDLDRPWTEVPLLFQGLVIRQQQHLDVLREHCHYVYVEVDKPFWQTLRQRQAIGIPATKLVLLQDTASIDAELPRANESYQGALSYIISLMTTIEAEGKVDLTPARAVVRQCVSSIVANPSAMFWIARIKQMDRYTAEHCLRVAIMAVAFGRFVGVPESRLDALGLCGMLHDIGKMKVPKEILNKPGRLTADEMAIMRQHAELGYQTLLDGEEVDASILDAALHHHERVDGLGYPKQLSGNEIRRFTRMISIIDAYDAITSDRCYRQGRSTLDALKVIYAERGRHFDSELAEQFIRMIGVYPPGTLVELATGEIAIVLTSNPNQRLLPRVKIIRDTNGQSLSPPITKDLAERADGVTRHEQRIRRALPDTELETELRHFIANPALLAELPAFAERT